MPTRSRAAAVCDATGADGADVSWAASPSASACATGRRGAEPGSAVEILSIEETFNYSKDFFSSVSTFSKNPSSSKAISRKVRGKLGVDEGVDEPY